MPKLANNSPTRQSALDISEISFRSPLRYPGGKQKAIDVISRMLPKKVGEYREPMVGGGSVFFHAKRIALAERYWINDKFKELVSFWKTASDERTCAKLIAELRDMHATFRDADDIKNFFLKARIETPRDAFRQALLFFFFNRVTFSGTTRAGGFSSSAAIRRFTESSIDRLEPLPVVLSEVRITNLDFEEVIDEPGSNVFLFLDPPYFSASRLYGKNGRLHEFDHERLASALKRTNHRFLITYDDSEEIRKLYDWAKVSNWQLQYGMNNCNSERLSKIGNELFIRNY